MRLLIIAIAFFGLTSCARVYQAPQFKSALKSHKTVGIIPAQVDMPLQRGELRFMPPHYRTETIRNTGYDMQKRTSAWLNFQQDRRQSDTQFQDVNITNALLKEAGWDYNDLFITQPSEYFPILKVDAIIINKLMIAQATSDAFGMVMGSRRHNKQIFCLTQVYEGASGKLLWSRQMRRRGQARITTNRLSNSLIRNTVKHLPYFQN